MVKKMGEIKEVISTSSNSTPVKVLMVDRIAGGDNDEVESNDGSDAGERHRRISGELGSYKGSCTNLKDYDEALPDNLFQTPKEEKVGKCYFQKTEGESFLVKLRNQQCNYNLSSVTSLNHILKIFQNPVCIS